MKANAPEKIYILPHKDYSDKRIINAFTEKEDNNDIEYIRTDAFIEKAVSYIQQHWIWNTKIIEDFKKIYEQ